MARKTKTPTTPVTPTPTTTTAKTVYVALTGSDTAAGTTTAPVRTIAKALNLANAGDTVVVRDGTYPEVVRITKSGTSTKLIDVTAEHAGKAVIDGSNSPTNTDLVTIAASNVRLSGFAIRNAKRSGVAVWKGVNVTLSNNFVSGSTRAGIWAGGDGLDQSKQLNITNNVVTNNCLENKARNWNGGWPRAIAVDVSTDVTISNNVVAKNYGEGIGLLSTPGRVTNNVVFDNYSVEVYLDNSPQTVVNGNLIFSSGDKEFSRNDKPAWGVLVANEETQFPMASTGISVTGNTLIGNGIALYVGPDTWSGTVVTNCTFSPNSSKFWVSRDDLVAMISKLVVEPSPYFWTTYLANWPSSPA